MIITTQTQLQNASNQFNRSKHDVKFNRLMELTYTNGVLSGISAGIKVNTDKNQQATNTKTGIQALHGIDRKRYNDANTPTTRKHHV